MVKTQIAFSLSVLYSQNQTQENTNVENALSNYENSLADLDPVVKSIFSLTSLLMTNLLNVVAKVFSNTLICLLQKCE